MNLYLAIACTVCVACSAWFAILAARTDRRENNPADYPPEPPFDQDKQPTIERLDHLIPTSRKGV